MTTPSFLSSAVALVAALLGAALLVYSTIRAVRPAAAHQGFGWMVIAGSGYLVLALASAVRTPQGDGMRAAALQGVTIVLAAALGGLALGQRQEGPGSGRQLAAVALSVAWLSLLGLPPALGFHARVLVCRSLVQAGWHGAFALALAVGAAGLTPAFAALSLGCPGSLRGGRAVLAVLLLLVTIVLGLYPGFAMSGAGFVLEAVRAR